MVRFTREIVDVLSHTNYFKLHESPACVAIMPLVRAIDVGVEIGVFMGTSSTVFLDHCRFMYFVDPCCTYPTSSDPTVYASADSFRKLVSQYGEHRYQFIEDYSDLASDKIPMVDFVFIDGNHKKKYVAKDIELYWPKVNHGGFLSGHDYDLPEVKSAVDEFVAETQLPLEIHQICWVVRKP